jgi:Na+-transporting NADH:ubiquinone oxidoreductase subunit B
MKVGQYSMLRKFLEAQLARLSQKEHRWYRLRPLLTAVDSFLYEPSLVTKTGPHIRDAVDLKRWMIIVVVALLPCIFMAIWNTGLQKMVYASGDYHLMDEYLSASSSLSGYFHFVSQQQRWITILELGALAFFPVMLISYAVGGFWEALFACVRRHEIAEGFLVTGMLYPLILPPTIPYWMVAVGVSVGVVIGKELFGGTGMNILNPALICRCFLFFTFPGQMTGSIWAGTNPSVVADSLRKMNEAAHKLSYDGYTQATPLAMFNTSVEVKRVHVDAIASNIVGKGMGTVDVLEQQLAKWNVVGQQQAVLGHLSPDQLQQFVTQGIDSGGLGLPVDHYQSAYELAGLNYGLGHTTDGNFFFGNMLGSLGETSVIACLLGALVLVFAGIASWRTMLSFGIGAWLTAWMFQFSAEHFGVENSAWNPAKFALPAYKHLLVGGLAFGLVFMATDPVTSPTMQNAKWIYGLCIGALVILIRVINPAYPEGVMLAILLMNCFTPLLDHYASRRVRRRRRVLA